MAVTDANVKAIIDTSRDTTPFIATATAVVTAAGLLSKGLDATLIDPITLYLSAHLVCLTEEMGGLRRSKTGDADESYRVPGEKEKGFATTRYGQQAMILDTTGTLAAMGANQGLKAQFEVVSYADDPVIGSE